MIKRVVLIGLIGAFVVGLLVITPIGTYVRTSSHRVGEVVKGSVPIDFELDRARVMVADLDKVIKNNKQAIVEEEVALAKLDSRLGDLKSQLDEDKGNLMTLRDALDEKKDVYRFAGQTFTSEQVKTDMERRFERFKTNDSTLQTLTEIRDARLQRLQATREKYDGLIASKRQLEVKIENLEARLRLVEANQVTNEFNFDGEIGDVKQLVDNLETRLMVSEKLASSSDFNYSGEIPLDGEQESDIVDRVTAYFGDPGTQDVTTLPAAESTEIEIELDGIEPEEEVN